MIKYIAFLRGINVGGHKVAMQDLQRVFEDMGLGSVKTYIASGNVTFETTSTNLEALTKSIEARLQTQFAFAIPVLLRTEERIRALAAADPFKGAEKTPQTKLYITLLTDKPTDTLDVPYKHPDKDFVVVYMSDGEICSVLSLGPQTDTTDLMKFLERQFGKNITTRNWNTIQKMID